MYPGLSQLRFLVYLQYRLAIEDIYRVNQTGALSFAAWPDDDLQLIKRIEMHAMRENLLIMRK